METYAGTQYSRPVGLIVACIIHALICLYLVLNMIGKPNPPIEAFTLTDGMGFTVNYGTSENGSGNIQPIGGEEIPPPLDNQAIVQPPQDTKTQDQQQAEKNILTTTHKDAVDIGIKEKKDKTKEVEQVNAIKPPDMASVDPVKVNPNPTKEPVKTVDHRATFPGLRNNSSSEGETSGNGDQGSTGGDPNALNHGPGWGRGTNPNGTEQGYNYNLAGRSAVYLPKIDCKSVNEDATVYVRIKVDQNGNVIEATAGVDRKTTTTNALLFKCAEEMAKAAKFSPSDKAEIQVGSIKYTFNYDER